METLRKAVIVVAVAVGVALVAGHENVPAQKPAVSAESAIPRHRSSRSDRWWHRGLDREADL
jgi:hypothetical protein